VAVLTSFDSSTEFLAFSSTHFLRTCSMATAPKHFVLSQPELHRCDGITPVADVFDKCF
jgi:hypothetical protein